MENLRLVVILGAVALAFSSSAPFEKCHHLSEYEVPELLKEACPSGPVLAWDECSIECRDALIGVADEVGCCITTWIEFFYADLAIGDGQTVLDKLVAVCDIDPVPTSIANCPESEVCGSCLRDPSVKVDTGCDVPEVEKYVCTKDPFCCDSNWDRRCRKLVVEEARELCPAACGDCDRVLGDTGCSVPAVEQCVCAMDRSCCDSSWDRDCQQKAMSDCAKYCPIPPPVVPPAEPAFPMGRVATMAMDTYASDNRQQRAWAFEITVPEITVSRLAVSPALRGRYRVALRTSPENEQIMADYGSSVTADSWSVWAQYKKTLYQGQEYIITAGPYSYDDEEDIAFHYANSSEVMSDPNIKFLRSHSCTQCDFNSYPAETIDTQFVPMVDFGYIVEG